MPMRAGNSGAGSLIFRHPADINDLGIIASSIARSCGCNILQQLSHVA
jgi:hypothetical protein